MIYKTSEYLRKKGVLDSIELWMLRTADYIIWQSANLWRVTCSQLVLKRSQYILLGGLWAGTLSAVFSIHSSMESKTPYIRKYSVVL